MKHLIYLKMFENHSYNNYEVVRDDNFYVDYTFSDDLGNKFLVQFKNITIGNKRLGKDFTFSYFVWDENTNDWSVSKIIQSNPFKIVRTVLGDIMDDFIKKKPWINKIQFEGLPKDTESAYQSKRTKIYLRFLKENPKRNFKVVNYGNNVITLVKNNK